MKHILLKLLFILAVNSCGSFAKADLIFYFANPGELTETTVFSATNGGALTVDIIGQLGTALDSLSSYAVSVRFDTSELDMISASESLPSGFQINITPGVFNNTDPILANRHGLFTEDIGTGLGQVSSFEASSFLGGPTAPTSFKVGSIQFQAVAVGGGEADIDLSLGFFFGGVDGALASDGMTSLTPNFKSAGVINAVPEPSGLLLVGLACSIMAVRKRRRR